MKKNNLLKLTFVICLALIIPLIIQGCDLFGGKAKLSLHQEIKTSYEINETLDVSGGLLKYIDEDGNESFIEITSDMVSGFTTQTAGTRNMVISYNQKQVMVEYTVYELELTDMVWYISQETTTNNMKYFVMFNFTNNKLAFIGSYEDEISSYDMSNIQWVAFTKTLTNGKFDIESEGMVQGISHLIQINNINNDTFTMLFSANNTSKTTIHLSKFVEPSALELTSGVWYVSQETITNNMKFFVKFNLTNKTIACIGNYDNEINLYDESNMYWAPYERNNNTLVAEGTHQGVSYSITIKDISDNTFTMIYSTNNNQPQTMHLSKFVG